MMNQYANQKKDRFQRAMTLLREDGLKFLIITCLDIIHHQILVTFSPLIIYLKPKRFFFFQNKKIPYFYHKYNITWKNERTFEVPFIWEIIKKHHEKKIFEVGNVLSHYFPINHDVLDKYEKTEGVINQDVVDFKPPNKYDLIVSILTLEHVGFDDNTKESTKIIKAIKNLKENCLRTGGRTIIAMPINYNHGMDILLFTNKLGFDKKLFLEDIKKMNGEGYQEKKQRIQPI